MAASLRQILAVKDIPGHFTRGKIYLAEYYYEVPEDQGWRTMDDSHCEHWLSKYDGKNHSVIEQEPYIKDNFIVLPVA